LPAAHAGVLAKLGWTVRASREFARAAELTRNEAKRAVFPRRAGTVTVEQC